MLSINKNRIKSLINQKTQLKEYLEEELQYSIESVIEFPLTTSTPLLESNLELEQLREEYEENLLKLLILSSVKEEMTSSSYLTELTESLCVIPTLFTLQNERRSLYETVLQLIQLKLSSGDSSGDSSSSSVMDDLVELFKQLFFLLTKSKDVTVDLMVDFLWNLLVFPSSQKSIVFCIKTTLELPKEQQQELLLRFTTSKSLAVVQKDTHCKFILEIVKNDPSLLLQSNGNIDSIMDMMDLYSADGYSIRVCVVECITLLIKHLSSSSSDVDDDVDVYDVSIVISNLVEILFIRLSDVSSFVRSKVLKCLYSLVLMNDSTTTTTATTTTTTTTTTTGEKERRNLVPVDKRYSLLLKMKDRLYDKASLVRKECLRLYQSLLVTHPFYYDSEYLEREEYYKGKLLQLLSSSSSSLKKDEEEVVESNESALRRYYEDAEVFVKELKDASVVIKSNLLKSKLKSDVMESLQFFVVMKRVFREFDSEIYEDMLSLVEFVNNSNNSTTSTTAAGDSLNDLIGVGLVQEMNVDFLEIVEKFSFGSIVRLEYLIQYCLKNKSNGNSGGGKQLKKSINSVVDGVLKQIRDKEGIKLNHAVVLYTFLSKDEHEHLMPYLLKWVMESGSGSEDFECCKYLVKCIRKLVSSTTGAATNSNHPQQGKTGGGRRYSSVSPSDDDCVQVLMKKVIQGCSNLKEVGAYCGFAREVLSFLCDYTSKPILVLDTILHRMEQNIFSNQTSNEQALSQFLFVLGHCAVLVLGLMERIEAVLKESSSVTSTKKKPASATTSEDLDLDQVGCSVEDEIVDRIQDLKEYELMFRKESYFCKYQPVIEQIIMQLSAKEESSSVLYQVSLLCYYKFLLVSSRFTQQKLPTLIHLINSNSTTSLQKNFKVCCADLCVLFHNLMDKHLKETVYKDLSMENVQILLHLVLTGIVKLKGRQMYELATMYTCSSVAAVGSFFQELSSKDQMVIYNNITDFQVQDFVKVEKAVVVVENKKVDEDVEMEEKEEVDAEGEDAPDGEEEIPSGQIMKEMSPVDDDEEQESVDSNKMTKEQFKQVLKYVFSFVLDKQVDAVIDKLMSKLRNTPEHNSSTNNYFEFELIFYCLTCLNIKNDKSLLKIVDYLPVYKHLLNIDYVYQTLMELFGRVESQSAQNSSDAKNLCAEFLQKVRALRQEAVGLRGVGRKGKSEADGHAQNVDVGDIDKFVDEARMALDEMKLSQKVPAKKKAVKKKRTKKKVVSDDDDEDDGEFYNNSENIVAN